MTISVLKIGGSVLRDRESYHACARMIRDRLRAQPALRVVIVVSARYGETDALLAEATSLCDPPDARTLDLLWSAGEIKSAAALALALHAAGVSAAALDVHQTGIRRTERLSVLAAPLQRAVARHAVVVVPGFLAAADDDSVVTLGRGGSDLSAVVIAAALRADTCELLKDVPGYFSADPNQDASAAHLPLVAYERALEMARDGCDLVQPAALEAARDAGLTLVLRAHGDPRQTIVAVRGQAPMVPGLARQAPRPGTIGA